MTAFMIDDEDFSDGDQEEPDDAVSEAMVAESEAYAVV
jgi:hypothetical protein